MEYEQIMQAVRNAHAAGDTEAATRLAAMALAAREAAEQEPEQSPAPQQPEAALRAAEPPQIAARPPSGPGSDLSAYDSSEVAPNSRGERGLGYRIMDNIVGYDDGVMTVGEQVAAALNNAGEAMTFGLVGDEAAAAADTLIGRGSGYDAQLAKYRQQEADLHENNPALYWGSEIAPAFLTAGGAARGLATMTRPLWQRATAGVATGAAAGATEGYMEGETSDQRFGEGMSGAILGGILGGTLPFAGRAVSGVYNRFGGGDSRAMRQTLRQNNLSPTAGQMVSEAVERDARTAPVNFARAQDSAVNAMSGPNTQGLLDWVVNRPAGSGAAIAAQVDDVATEAAQRFTGVLDDVLGQPAGVTRATRQVMQDTAEARGGAYADAYATAIDYSAPAAKELDELISRVPQRAVNAANDMLTADGHRSQQIMASIADDGTVTFSNPLDVRQIDYITRAVRDMSSFGTGTGQDQGRIYSSLARDIRTKLDELVPEYGAARAAGADAIASREAIQTGRDLLSRSTPMDVAEDALSAMDDGELSFARQGVRSYVDEIMANTQRALTNPNMDAREVLRPLREMTSRAGRAKLAALLGDEGANRLQSEAERALVALEMRASTAMNSRTAMRQTVEGIVADRLPTTAGEAIEDGRGILGALSAAARPVLTDGASPRFRLTDDLVGEIGAYLMRSPATSAVSTSAQGLPDILRNAAARSDFYSRQTQGILGGAGMSGIAAMNNVPN